MTITDTYTRMIEKPKPDKNGLVSVNEKCIQKHACKLLGWDWNPFTRDLLKGSEGCCSKKGKSIWIDAEYRR